MKINMSLSPASYKNIWVSIVLLTLVFSFLPSSGRTEEKEEKAISSVSRQSGAQTPQTPEELLQVIKVLFANPDEDGHVFFEKKFGVERTNWIKSKLSGTPEKECLDLSHRPHVPFQVAETCLDHKDHVYKFEVWFFNNPDFHMTPKIIQQFLEAPTKIWVSSPKDDNSAGEYRITYRYKTEKHVFDILFINPEEAHNKEIESAFRGHTPEQIQTEKARRRSFDIHKDYIAICIELTRL